MKKRFYTNLNKNFVKLFDEKVKDASSVVITSHMSPDDDSISSILSIYFYLTEYLNLKKSKVKLMITGEKVNRWEYFKGFENIEFVENLGDNLRDVDVLIMLDGSSWKRFIRGAEPNEFDGFTICIDHHPNPGNKFDLHMLIVDYVSTAEIIYKLFLEDKKIDKGLAETIFLGVWGDTGGLRFVKPEETSAFDTIRRLVDIGKIDIQILTSKYQKIDFNIFSILSELMTNTEIKEIKDWPPVQYSYLDRNFIKKGKLTESVVSDGYHLYVDTYVRMIKGADWGFATVPKKEGFCYFSFRSLPESVNVRKIAEEFGGGGHDRAAATKMEVSDTDEAIKKVFDWMKSNKPIIS